MRVELEFVFSDECVVAEMCSDGFLKEVLCIFIKFLCVKTLVTWPNHCSRLVPHFGFAMSILAVVRREVLL